MKPRDLALPALLDELGRARPVGEDLCASELFRRWEAAFGAHEPLVHLNECAVRWSSAFPKIRFRGMNDVQIMLASGPAFSAITLAAARLMIQPGRTPILLVPAASALAGWRLALSSQGILILGPEQIISVFTAPDPSSALRDQFRARISTGRLDPFDFQVPAQGNMFYGREHELRLLREKETQSFAIAGPGRIGKTSLALAYRDALKRDRDPRADRVRFMDCLHMASTVNETALLRFIAGEIEKGRRASQMSSEDFPAFIRYQRHQMGGPLELIIDEVDGVCHTPVFAMLAESSKHQHCRLLLCGKANLLHAMLVGRSPLALRLGLLRPEPLSREDARRLFIAPLHDLGIQVEAAALEMVLNLTGCLPHQLQFYASQFLESAARRNLSTVTPGDIETIRDSVLSQQFLRGALKELDPVSRALALLILEAQPQSVSIPFLQQMAQKHGLPLGADTAMESLISMHIHNFLAMEKGEYRIATGSLIASAQRHGFLKADLREALEVWRQHPDLGFKPYLTRRP